MATHSSILAWRIPWTVEPDGLQSMGLQRVVHDWTHTDTCTILRENSAGLQMGCNISVTSWIFVSRVWCVLFCPSGEGNGNPLQYSCLENPRDGGAWWAAIYGVTQSQTRLKRLSSSSSRLVVEAQTKKFIQSIPNPFRGSKLIKLWNTLSGGCCNIKVDNTLLLLLSHVSRVWLCVTP